MSTATQCQQTSTARSGRHEREIRLAARRQGGVRGHWLRVGEAGVALFDGGKLVGTGAKGNIFLLPDYRGDELATEMMAEFYAMCPALMEQRLQKRIAQTFTPEGRATCHRAYEMLVDRKVIIDPTKLRRTG